MKRRTVHSLFVTVAAIIAVFTVYHGMALYRAVRVNDGIAHADQRVHSRITLSAVIANRDTELADALALTRAGDDDAAVKAFNDVISHGSLDTAGQAALYDLGNLYLKRAYGHATEDAGVFIPLVELSKQRYRDLLRLHPDRWDARYNLERALRLAPEDNAAFTWSERDDQGRRRVLIAPDQIAPNLP